jgi:hypothetical protein
MSVISQEDENVDIEASPSQIGAVSPSIIINHINPSNSHPKDSIASLGAGRTRETVGGSK